MMLASFMTLFANANKGKKHSRFKITNFLPPWWKRHDSSADLPDWQELKEKMMALNKALGGNVDGKAQPEGSRWQQ